MWKLLARIFPVSFLAAVLVLVLSVNFLPGDAQSCNSNGFLCLSCSTAQICVGGSPLGVPFVCPAGTICDPTATLECTLGSCFSCSAAGRFVDPYADNKYILCISNGAGGFVQTSVTCPTGSNFNSVTKLCTLIPTTTTTTTTAATTTTTTAATTTTTVATTTPIYPCVAVGRFPDTTNCSNYFMCQTNPAGGYYVNKYSCPRTTLFSASLLKCVLSASSGCVVTG